MNFSGLKCVGHSFSCVTQPSVVDPDPYAFGAFGLPDLALLDPDPGSRELNKINK